MKKKKRHIASEQQSFEELLEEFSRKEKLFETIFARVKRIVALSDSARVLDVGAGGGSFLVACERLGYRCEGIEPWEEARLNAIKLSEHMGVPVRIVDGMAESIPYGDETFDMVHALSVVEHVSDVEKAFNEIYRVLKPGGVFWFDAASSMCPVQDEIRGFPLFGWYPNILKIKIMHWVKDSRPHLVGHTRTPAINWFTPRKVRILLKRQGFKRVHDRWDLYLKNEGGKLYRLILCMIRSSAFTRTLADILIPGCSYLAVK